MSEQIVCKNVTLGYEDGAVAENLNFTVNKGDYLFVLGENGSGKSTLVKTLLGLTGVLSGEISGSISHKEIGYLPQQTLVQRDFPASVREIVLSGCLSKCGLRPFYNSREKALAQKAMEELGITDLSTRCYRELSGGQQQRVLLARALCATGSILLLDEPVTGLDPMAAADMYAIIERLNKNGITVIMISHDIDAAAKYASHVLHMGENIFYGTLEEFAQSEQGRDFFKAGDTNA
ncbi:MAG: metal ABC transporter ATP-binding protein [Firmicutes bacterium]|nr:metal ABC transporter ATP-binding protein [Bacillota bacterium]